jgi:pyruvate ferredoxin oxidoreductase alpha subunit
MKARMGFTGDEAFAYAAKQSMVDVVSAYPITPQTIMVELFSEYVANGEVHTNFVCVESEHSALSACVGASLTGARVLTATSSQGLALMHEIMYIASGLRCPIVMGVANRALSAPLNIHGDQSDMMGSRDCGWAQIYCENAQEAYDWTLQAFKIAENPDVLLPVTVNLDGFILSHAMEGVEVMTDQEAKMYLPGRKVEGMIDPSNPGAVGPLVMPDYYFEFKRQQEEAIRHVPATLQAVTQEYAKLTGRKYGIVDEYETRDADVVIVALGSTAGTIRSVAKALRKKGKKVGLLKLWLYRPFPTKEVAEAIAKSKVVVVFDRALSQGAPYGALCQDVISTAYAHKIKPVIVDAVYGLGGRDISPAEIESIYEEALTAAKTGTVKEQVKFVGVRE